MTACLSGLPFCIQTAAHPEPEEWSVKDFDEVTERLLSPTQAERFYDRFGKKLEFADFL